MRARLPHQRDVAVMEVAHGRHEHHAAGRPHRGAHAGYGFVDLHLGF
jgi:hypothetical protein